MDLGDDSLETADGSGQHDAEVLAQGVHDHEGTLDLDAEGMLEPSCAWEDGDGGMEDGMQSVFAVEEGGE